MSEAQQSKTEREFSIQRVYLKDLSFETPGSPGVFREQWQPEMNLELNTKHEPLMDGVYEVILSGTVTVKSQETTVFLIEAKYAGIFTIQGFIKDEVDALLGSVVPTILFPYLRECISEVANRGSFPQLLLAPVNFEALYAEQVQKKRMDTGETVVQ